MHCCCCCCPAAPARPLLPCRLWATALWTSQCLPPAVWDLWCPHRWRCMFAPKAPTGCFCCPAASRRRRKRIRRGKTRSRIISQVAGICKSLPMPSERVPSLWFFSSSSHFRIFRAAASDKQPVARATSAVPQLSPPFATFVACRCRCCCCCSLCSLNTSSTGVPTQGDLHAASDPYRHTRAIMKYFTLLHFVSFRFGLDLGFIPVSCHTPSGPLAKS